jgi:hypothetical protein
MKKISNEESGPRIAQVLRCDYFSDDPCRQEIISAG